MNLKENIIFSKYYTWDIYKESPIMSTFLLTFVVSDFLPIKNKREQFNIWGRKHIIHYGDEAQYAAYKFYKSIKEMNKLEKLDLVGLPNSNIGPMENWGLFTFR